MTDVELHWFIFYFIHTLHKFSNVYHIRCVVPYMEERIYCKGIIPVLDIFYKIKNYGITGFG
jgi:hypothetical protein